MSQICMIVIVNRLYHLSRASDDIRDIFPYMRKY
nr:MAG TPA: hypothetical protein [Caudoviricetes sp.]